MPDPPDPVRTLTAMLDRTRDSEIDCDTFVEGLAELVEGTLPEDRRALFEHHRRICPDCAEQLDALERALQEP